MTLTLSRHKAFLPTQKSFIISPTPTRSMSISTVFSVSVILWFPNIGFRSASFSGDLSRLFCVSWFLLYSCWIVFHGTHAPSLGTPSVSTGSPNRSYGTWWEERARDEVEVQAGIWFSWGTLVFIIEENGEGIAASCATQDVWLASLILEGIFLLKGQELLVLWTELLHRFVSKNHSNFQE